MKGDMTEKNKSPEFVVPEGNSHIVLEQIVKPLPSKEYFDDSNEEPFCCTFVKTKRKLDNLKMIGMEYPKISLELPEIGKPYGEAEKRVYDGLIEMARRKDAQFLFLSLNKTTSVDKYRTYYTYLVRFYNSKD